MDRLQERLGYVFRDPRLLEQALTHPSRRQDHPAESESNQRLEFLGDAVLQLILSGVLFELFPGEREGGLSRRRAALGRGASLARLAREINLDRCLRLGASEETSGGRDRDSALEDAFEALVGALFLDSDFPTARRIVGGIYGDLRVRLAQVEDAENPKGRLQERIQPVHGNQALHYEVIAVEGADHARAYVVSVLLNGQPIGQGRGASKKLAEEAAARAGLDKLDQA